MNLVRSLTGPRLDCSLGYADQLNSNSHWLDGSTIYGSDDATTNSVRSFTGGQLKMTYDPILNRYYLPISPNCPNGACFFAGMQLKVIIDIRILFNVRNVSQVIHE